MGVAYGPAVNQWGDWFGSTVNLASRSKIGTVGPALPGVSVRVVDDGEIQVKGINVFKEYWKNPAATADTFDGDWLKTGDIGSFHSEGVLTNNRPQQEVTIPAGGTKRSPPAPADPTTPQTLVAQQVLGVLDAARRAERSLLGGVAEPHAELLAVAEVVADEAGEELHRHDGLGEAVPRQEAQHVLHDRLVDDRQERLGHAGRHRSQPGPLPAGHDHGLHVVTGSRSAATSSRTWRT